MSQNTPTEYAIHFGIVPTDPDLNYAVPPVLDIDGERVSSTTEEVSFGLLPDVAGLTLRAFVSGSWKCWGTPDQETEGDDTLHVLVYVNEEPDRLRIGQCRDLVADMVVEGRVLDYAILSDIAEWSENHVVVTLDYIPHIWS